MHSKYRRRRKGALERLLPSITSQLLTDAEFAIRRGEKPDYTKSLKDSREAKDIRHLNERRAWEAVRLEHLLAG